MIKINLPSNFYRDQRISNIFHEIAKKIYYTYRAELREVWFVYYGMRDYFSSPDKIQRFLMAKDFYAYKFENKSGFMCDLLNLRPNVKIANVLINASTSKKVKNFCRKYDKTTYKEEYLNLEAYDQLTIAQFKQIGTHPTLVQNKLLQDIFSYQQLSSGDRHELLIRMDVPVCPYCNMNYTINFEDKEQQRSTADIDHFYLKSKYPEYALCLYNFIPACSVCNQKIKGITDMTRDTYAYPYQDSFEGQSQFRVTNLVEYLTQPETDVQIELVSEHICKRISNSIIGFKLNERYKSFSYYATDLIEKALIYNEAYANSLIKSFDGFVRDTDIKKLIFGTKLSEEEYGRLSLGKLRQDLLTQLGVY